MSPSAEQTSTDGHVYFTETNTNANVPTIETQMNALSCHSDDVYNVSCQNISIPTMDIMTFKTSTDGMLNPLSKAMMRSLQVPRGHTVMKAPAPSLALSVSSKTTETEYQSSEFEGPLTAHRAGKVVMGMGNITITRVSADGNSKRTERSL